MRKMHTLLGAAAALGLMTAAACSGGSEGPPAAEGEEAETETPAAEAETADAPTADSTDTIDGTVYADFTGDATAGKAVFVRCRTCHVLEPGVNRTGPSLHNIVGCKAGQVEAFNYTDANANNDIVWTPEKLFQYLENPVRVIPGTRMAFAGLPKAQDRADLIAFLQTE